MQTSKESDSIWYTLTYKDLESNSIGANVAYINVIDTDRTLALLHHRPMLKLKTIQNQIFLCPILGPRLGWET